MTDLQNVSKAIGGPTRANAHLCRMFCELIEQIPERHHATVTEQYIRKLEGTTGPTRIRHANEWLRGLSEKNRIHGDHLLADDAQALADAAERYSKISAKILERHALSVGEQYAASKGVYVNWAPTTTEEGNKKRLACPNWWRRQLRKAHWQSCELFEREIGAVSYQAGRYASHSATRRRAQQNADNQAKLASTNLISPDGTPIPLLEISQHNVTDKTIRRHETLARIRGIDEYERKRGSVAQFWTITTPSKYHSTNSNGKPNSNYKGYTPKDASNYLLEIWQRFRALMHNMGVEVSGMRIAEPHHDGTPHHHYIVYMAPEKAEYVWSHMARLARAEDRKELYTPKLLEIRAKCIEIDERGVVGYVLKYICKSLDGSQETDKPNDEAAKMTAIEAARRVDAWASHWRIRQFAFFGGRGKAMIWRALRGVEVLPPEAPEDIKKAHSAARAGEYSAFIEHSDGFALVSNQTGEVSYYDGHPIERPFAVVNGYGEFVELPQHEWTLEVNRTLRNALTGIKRICSNVTDWSVQDIIDPVPF